VQNRRITINEDKAYSGLQKEGHTTKMINNLKYGFWLQILGLKRAHKKRSTQTKIFHAQKD
jgi:hypothetical protein